MFLNETISILRKRIASSIDQTGAPFRTSELILCHLTDIDEDVLGKTFANNGMDQAQTESDALKWFELLYSRFTGVVQPRKIEEEVE